ncbi:MAG: hypothetical protein IPK82_33725 [Polyangiaceae bacterium]|nr:hypothetical protein [Polyangiaceae bacterium]
MSVGLGCASTEFVPEGPGQPPERSKGTVPSGSVGTCRRPQTRKPPIVNAAVWEHSPVCTSRTPDSFVRLGYGREPSGTPPIPDQEAEKWLERLTTTIAEGNDPKEGNNKIVLMLRGLQDYSLRQPVLRDRVTRESSRPTPCDFTYMLNTMVQERAKLKPNDQCTAYVYDPKERKDVCLFDMSAKGVSWLTSSYDCMTRIDPANSQSCHALCAYDDYCTRQVSCTATDIDLMLCASGVCLPEPRTPIF